MRYTKGRLPIPELPEVETVRRELEPWLVGRHIQGAELIDAVPHVKYANLPNCVGQRIEAVNRRGKFLLLPLDDGDELIIHLGMTGIVTGEKPEKHVRVHLELSKPKKATKDAGSNDLYFQDTRRFGRFLVVKQGEYKSLPTLHNMGVEPISEDFTDKVFKDALQKSSTAVKTYLLSQKPVAGVGNIYADEALWQTKIHPLTPSNKVPTKKIPLLRQAIVEILKKSIEAQGTTLNDYRTVNGEVGAYISELKAYGHDGEACERCGVIIEKIVVGGRGTHFCPACQKVPTKK